VKHWLGLLVVGLLALAAGAGQSLAGVQLRRYPTASPAMVAKWRLALKFSRVFMLGGAFMVAAALLGIGITWLLD
jgi:hypothetical protein